LTRDGMALQHLRKGDDDPLYSICFDSYDIDMDHRPFVYGPINLPILSTRLPQLDLKERSHKC